MKLYVEYIPPEIGGPEPAISEDPHYIGTYTIEEGTLDMWFFQTVEGARRKYEDLILQGYLEEFLLNFP